MAPLTRKRPPRPSSGHVQYSTGPGATGPAAGAAPDGHHLRRGGAHRGRPRRMWARHKALLANRTVPTVPAPVVAQTWRGGGRQGLLSKLLVGCGVEALDDDQARTVRSLATKAIRQTWRQSAPMRGCRLGVALGPTQDGCVR